MLTKTQFKKGRKCPKALWMTIHMPEVKAPLSAAILARMSSGREVGQLAQIRYPGGVLAPYYQVSALEAHEATAKILNAGPPAIFEATFVVEDLQVRCDVLEKTPGGWKIVEVKAASAANKDYLDDIAFQVMVAKKAGLIVTGASILHFNKEYVWEGGPYDIESMLAETDVTRDVDKVLYALEREAERFLTLWDETDYPTLDGKYPHVDPGMISACRSCDFAAHCRTKVPEDHVFFLGLHSKTLKTIRAEGIRLIRDVPESALEKPVDLLRWRSWQSRKVEVTPGLTEAIAKIQYPAYLIDFETLRPDLPVLPGTRPFQVLPFQWSCHRLDRPPIGSDAPDDINEGHTWFLHEEQSDPREAFCRSPSAFS